MASEHSLQGRVALQALWLRVTAVSLLFSIFISLVVNIWRNLIKSVIFAVHLMNRLKFDANPYDIINEAFVL